MIPQANIRVAIADDHHIVRDGICQEIHRCKDMDIVGEAVDGRAAIALVKETKPDVLLLDISMPELTGVEVLRILRDDDCVSRDTSILVLSAYSDREYVYHAFALGAQGYLLKDEYPRTIVEGVRRLMRGQPVLSKAIQQIVVMSHQRHPNRLTEREQQVIRLVARGFSDCAISEELSITTNTVKNHITSIYSKLPSVRTRAEAVAWAWQNNLVRGLPEV